MDALGKSGFGWHIGDLYNTEFLKFSGVCLVSLFLLSSYYMPENVRSGGATTE